MCHFCPATFLPAVLPLACSPSGQEPIYGNMVRVWQEMIRYNVPKYVPFLYLRRTIWGWKGVVKGCRCHRDRSLRSEERNKKQANKQKKKRKRQNWYSAHVDSLTRAHTGSSMLHCWWNFYCTWSEVLPRLSTSLPSVLTFVLSSPTTLLLLHWCAWEKKKQTIHSFLQTECKRYI